MSRARVVRQVAATVVIVGSAPVALGQSFNIDIDGAIGSGAGAPASSWGAAAGQSGIWNAIVFQPNNPGPFALVDASGNPTGVTLRQTGATGTLNFTQNATSGNTKLLMDDAVFAATAYTITVSGLAAGTYTFYTYANAPSGSGGFERNGVIIAGASSPNPQSIGGPIIAGTPLVNGMTHAIHNITVTAGQNVVINATPFNGGNAYINGIQIVRAVAPLAEITTPSESSCVCGNVLVFGTAANLTGFTLDFAASDAGPWTTINSQSNPVVGGIIGVWNTAPLASGDYILRLRVNGPLQQQASYSRRIYVDRSAPSVSMLTPAPSEVVGGLVQITGDADDRCLSSVQVSYATSANGPFTPITTGQTSTILPGIDTLASWDTIDANLPDGNYFLRLFATDSCGAASQIVRSVSVDNTPPTLVLQSPTASDTICGNVAVSATINDPNLATWTLYYASDARAGWTQIAAGTQNANGNIANWDTSRLASGPYTLRLVARDRATVDGIGLHGNLSEATRSIFVGMQGDLNRDNRVDGADLGILLSQFGFRCN